MPPLKSYFSRVVYSGGHDLSSISVSEVKVDAAFVASHRFMETVNAGKVKLEDFNILWSSPMIPQDPFVYRNTLCEDLRKKISEEVLLRYNGMLASVFELLADSREQVAAVNAYLEALREFWLADASLQASLNGSRGR